MEQFPTILKRRVCYHKELEVEHTSFTVGPLGFIEYYKLHLVFGLRQKPSKILFQMKQLDN